MFKNLNYIDSKFIIIKKDVNEFKIYEKIYTGGELDAYSFNIYNTTLSDRVAEKDIIVETWFQEVVDRLIDVTDVVMDRLTFITTYAKAERLDTYNYHIASYLLNRISEYCKTAGDNMKLDDFNKFADEIRSKAEDLTDSEYVDLIEARFKRVNQKYADIQRFK